MDALDVIHLAIKLINNIVKICDFIMKFSEFCRNTQRISEEGSKQLFFSLLCLIIIYYLFIIHYLYKLFVIFIM